MLEILDARIDSDFQRWVDVWREWPQREVFAHPGYVRLYSSDKAVPLCALWRSSEGVVLYPFLLRSFDGEAFWSPDLPGGTDITSPYGYGGAFAYAVEDGRGLSEQFWGAFGGWAQKANVVSEFVRFSLFADTLLEYPGVRDERMVNVVRDLGLSEDELWMDFEHKVRKNVKKAQRSGVSVELDPCGEKLDRFLEIYYRTMGRRGARQSYYFSEAFFSRILNDLPGQFMFFHAMHQERVVSTELVLISAETVYSFLGGTEEDAFDLRPNDLLKYEIIMWAKGNQKRRFVLGGGYGAEDGIYRYKLGFAPSGQMGFSTGQRILNTASYQQLVEYRRRNDPDFSQHQGAGFFPAYRA